MEGECGRWESTALGNGASAVTTNAGVLADRIRALRTVASRAHEERSL